MNKLEVGMYVRTENGLIGKIIGFKGDMVETDNKRLITYKSYHNECKIKEDIIKLIEVGDYVNGYKVSDIRKDIIYCCEDDFEDYCIKYESKNIKSIVTKEMFEQMKYEVE